MREQQSNSGGFAISKAHPPDPTVAHDNRRRFEERRRESEAASTSLGFDNRNALDEVEAIFRDFAEATQPVEPLYPISELERYIPLRINPGNEREATVDWPLRSEQSALEWLEEFETFVLRLIALPERERRMALRAKRRALYTMMKGAEGRAVDLPSYATPRLDAMLERLERFFEETNPDTPLRASGVRQFEQSQTIGRGNDSVPVYEDELTRYRIRRALRAAENRGHGVRGSLSSGPPDWAREFRARGEWREPFADWKGR